MRKKRVLVVDDDALIRQAVTRLLTGRGYHVVSAADGEEALRQADEHSFDIAIVDYEMPGRDGLRVLSDLRTGQPGCIRVLMTGRAEFPVVVAAVNRGEILRVVSKPFEPNELVALLEDAYTSAREMEKALEAQRKVTLYRDRKMFEECLSSDMLQLALQPILDAHTEQLYGYEALLRSSHPVLSGPLPVLGVAERTGGLSPLARVVSERAAAILDELPEHLRLFLNLHPDSLGDPKLLTEALAPVVPYASRCAIEITERSKLSSIEDWEKVIDKLQDTGFKIAVDDLGSGYNSLCILADLQPTYIKVDMSIVRDVDRTPRKQRLVDLLARFAEATDSVLLAEGVETSSEAETLRACGSHLVQGYHFGKPQLWVPKASRKKQAG